MAQECLRWSTYDVQPQCYEYRENWLKDRHGGLHARWIFGPIIAIIAVLLIGGILVSTFGGPTPNVGDVRTQVYQCHRSTTYIQTGKVLVPSTWRSCGWETTDYVRNGSA